MSEPVSKAEIEDVVSSIRKLVSENGESDPGDSAGADKFVLTPAFRIAEPQAGDEAINGSQPVHDLGESKEETAALNVREAVENPDKIDLAKPFDADGDVEKRSSLEDRIAELEEAVGRTQDEWEPDGSKPDSDPPSTVIFRRTAEIVPDAEHFEIQEHASTLVDKDKVIASMPEGQDEPDFVQQVRDEIEVIQSNDTSVDADVDDVDSAAEAAAFLEDDEAFLDEDALRELVSHLVREELQGPIGERITRNVRRMVQREIQRALSLKEFE